MKSTAVIAALFTGSQRVVKKGGFIPKAAQPAFPHKDHSAQFRHLNFDHGKRHPSAIIWFRAAKALQNLHNKF